MVDDAQPSGLGEPSAAVGDQFGRPLRSLRLSLTDRCNLRCGYCMPEDSYRWLPKAELLNFDELGWLVDRFVNLGVHRVRLTGGEPLLRRDVWQVIARLSDNAAIDDVALTTNGLLLVEQLPALRTAGLRRLTISIDTLKRQRFLELTRRDALKQVKEAVLAAQRAGYAGYDARGQARLKLDTVVMRGLNDDELVPLIAFARAHQAEVRFIEYMDVGGATQWSPNLVYSRADMLRQLRRHFGEVTAMPGRGSAPAERFQLPDGTLFGIIASTTTPFCGTCDRCRVTADGMLFSCLYANAGHDLKTLLRGGGGEQAFEAWLSRIWRTRDDRGAEQRLLKPRAETLISVAHLRRDPHLEMHTRGG